ncbi:MAG: polysaccharide deacetylase family protein [Bacteroidota bacterium]|nr:polysaccharide deacetylase family protein [Bacteroidota bacterium]
MIYFLIIPAAVIFLLLAWLILEQGFLIPPKKGLPVLMYHKVSPDRQDSLTITSQELEKHFEYLQRKGYHTLHFKDLEILLRQGDKLPAKSVILSFDDAYENFYTLVIPLLEKYKHKATSFIPVAYIGKTNIWDKGSEPVMTADELKEISRNPQVEIGLHSFLHRSYKDLALEDMQEDLRNCFETLNFHHIPFSRVLAYPYGGYPKKDKKLLQDMKQLFKQEGLSFALRIGNRINSWPLKDPYEMKRIDIRGTDNFYTFRTKFRKGRKKLFA